MFRPPMDWAKEKSTNQSSFVCCVIVYHRVALWLVGMSGQGCVYVFYILFSTDSSFLLTFFRGRCILFFTFTVYRD